MQQQGVPEAMALYKRKHISPIGTSEITQQNGFVP